MTDALEHYSAMASEAAMHAGPYDSDGGHLLISAASGMSLRCYCERDRRIKAVASEAYAELEALPEFPAPRTDREVLADIACLLEESLAVQKHLLAALRGGSDSRSSVEIKTSTRGVDVSTKVYAGSDIGEAERAAVDSYLRVCSELTARLVNGGRS